MLGVDLGAGSLKATLIDKHGRVAASAAQPLATAIPQPGWSEQDPQDWYRALRQALNELPLADGPIAGLGISAGAHIPVLLDRHDRVIRPAILWNDQRSAAQARELHRRAGELIVAASLNRVNPTWSLAMLAWLKRHEPNNAASVRKFMLAKDYLRFRLTGDWHSDFSDAVGALLADNATRGWSAPLCRLIDWPMETLPPLAAPTAIVGEVTAQAAAETGLLAGTPVVCASNDTTVELLAAGAVAPGQATLKLATAGVLSRVTDGPRVSPPISCYPHLVDGLYYTATGTNSCASAHRWLRDQFFDSFAAMDALAGRVASGSGGLIFHPYLQGERAPYWDPALRGDFIGLTMAHTRAHFARALLEGVAYSLRDLLEQAQVQDHGRRVQRLRLIGGGARSRLWRHIVCDVLGLPMDVPDHGDASYGAAMVAGVGIGVFESLTEAVKLCVRIGHRHRPDAANHALYSQLFTVYKDAQTALAPLNHRLQQLVHLP